VRRRSCLSRPLPELPVPPAAGAAGAAGAARCRSRRSRPLPEPPGATRYRVVGEIPGSTCGSHPRPWISPATVDLVGRRARRPARRRGTRPTC